MVIGDKKKLSLEKVTTHLGSATQVSHFDIKTLHNVKRAFKHGK